MFSLYLTQSGGFFGTIAKPFGWILNGIYEALSFIGIENVAVCIVLFTIVTKAIMIPLTIKQQKFSKMSSIMQPELAKIQEKYKGKKDQASLQKMQLEQQAVYEKYGANPVAGCLPLLITLPIIMAMYRVVQNIPAYVNDIYNMYEPIAKAVNGIDGHADIIKEMTSAAQTKAIVTDGVISVNHLIDIFGHFNTSQWSLLAEKFPQISDLIHTQSKHIVEVNSLFMNLNVSNTCTWAFPGVLLPILAAATQWFQSKLLQVNNPTDKNNPTASAMNGMTTFMPIMSGIFLTMMPVGIGIYWIVGSVFAIIQQICVNKYMDKIDVNELVEKSKAKASAKRAKVSGVTGNALRDAAKTQTKSIESEESNTAKVVESKSTKNYAKMSSTREISKNSEVSSKAGSIAQNANLLKNRYNGKGEK